MRNCVPSGRAILQGREDLTSANGAAVGEGEMVSRQKRCEEKMTRYYANRLTWANNVRSR